MLPHAARLACVHCPDPTQMTDIKGWPVPARTLLERSIERYGGDAGRQRLGRVSFEARSASGLLFWLKGLGKTFRLPPCAEIDGRSAQAVFQDFPSLGQRGLFDAGRVGIGYGSAPPALTEHRAQLQRSGAFARWSPIDALYFFGYALSHYQSLPWSLREARVLSCDTVRRTLSVRFPPHVHTHCPRQTFYFDASGLIVRHDYVADVVGWWARGAHYWYDYTDVGGTPVAQRRVVYVRLGPFRLPLVALDVRLRAFVRSPGAAG